MAPRVAPAWSSWFGGRCYPLPLCRADGVAALPPVSAERVGVLGPPVRGRRVDPVLPVPCPDWLSNSPDTPRSGGASRVPTPRSDVFRLLGGCSSFFCSLSLSHAFGARFRELGFPRFGVASHPRYPEQEGLRDAKKGCYSLSGCSELPDLISQGGWLFSVDNASTVILTKLWGPKVRKHGDSLTNRSTGVGR